MNVSLQPSSLDLLLALCGWWHTRHALTACSSPRCSVPRVAKPRQYINNLIRRRHTHVQVHVHIRVQVHRAVFWQTSYYYCHSTHARGPPPRNCLSRIYPSYLPEHKFRRVLRLSSFNDCSPARFQWGDRPCELYRTSINNSEDSINRCF